MTTPSDSPERPAEDVPGPDQPTGPTESIPSQSPAAATSPPQPAAAPSPTATAPPAGPPAPPAWAPVTPMTPMTPAGEPFAPVARGPRTPWVNPARRGHVVAAAVVGALIFAGGGVLIGHAVTDHGDRHGVVRFERPQVGVPGYGRGQFPPRQGEPRHRIPAPSGAPTPAPSGSATS